jgi:predicted RNase H-like HicB family nuclease
MKLDEKLWHEAEQLAARHYAVEQFEETLTDGQVVIVLRHPELPGCISDGATLEEAEHNLAEARTEYIYLLLVDGLPVLAPHNLAPTLYP